MKRNTIIFLIATSTVIALLGNSDNEEYYLEDGYTTEITGQEISTKVNKSTSNGEKEMKAFKDPKTGKILSYIPLPQSWKINKLNITGPNGLKITNHGIKSYMMSQAREMNAKQILQNNFSSHIRKEGGQIMSTFPINGLAAYDRKLYSKLVIMGQTNDKYDVIGVDVKNSDGSMTLLIIRQSSHSYGYDGMWYFETQTLECNRSYYEEAKRDLIFGLSNMSTDQNFIAQHNQNEAQKAQASWSRHNQKMRNNEASFQATQRAHVASSNAVSDMGMQNYRNSSESFNRTNRMEMNAINGTEGIYDPMSGNNYNVESGYDRYFMNGQGEYFGTNDQFYQPGSDLNLNGQWEESQRYGN